MADAVRVVTDDGVATVTVENPPVNALSEPVMERLGEVAVQIAGDPCIRAVVLTGTGDRAFLAGADLKEFRDTLGDREKMEEHVAVSRPAFAAWAALETPVVAAVNSHAVGGGLEFALVCDFIVTEPGAKFGLPEVTLGLMPGAGGTQRLPARIGLGPARELTLLGKLVEADRALELGLVDRVSAEGAVVAEAGELAARLAALPGRAVRAIKQALASSADLPLDEGLELEGRSFLEVTMTPDAREGAEAFLERRRPVFKHR